jgi:hypothetical protein
MILPGCFLSTGLLPVIGVANDLTEFVDFPRLPFGMDPFPPRS